MIRKKQTLTEAHEVPANGRPTEVKVGYRNIKIKYVNPSFVLDDMTDSYGSTGPEKVLFIYKTH